MTRIAPPQQEAAKERVDPLTVYTAPTSGLYLFGLMPFRDPVFTRIFCTGFLAGIALMAIVVALLVTVIAKRCAALY